MMNMKLLGSMAAIAVTGIAVACAPSSSPPVNGSDSVNESVEGRSAYSEVPLPPVEQRVGADPKQIALNAFGMEEPVEGNFTQDVTLVEQTPTDAVVMLTQTGVPDDSVEGMRYWLEFAAGENQWELSWAGRQVRCRANRGSQEWSTDLCT